MLEAVYDYLARSAQVTYSNLYRSLMIFAFFLVLERFIAAEKKHGWRGMLFNVKWATVYHVMVAFIISPAVAAASVYIVRKLGGGGLIKLDLLKPAWLAYMSPLIYFFVIDGFYYWFHRLQHTIPFMWEQHKLHHSEDELNITTSELHHWLESVFRLPITYVPMALLFDIDYSTAGLIGFLTSYWAFFIHANLRIYLGPLTGVFCGPQIHRIHHSRLPEHTDKNFAAYFPIYDIIFGTYYRPSRSEYPPTGLLSGEKVETLRDAFMLPFVGWARMYRERQAHKRLGTQPLDARIERKQI